MSASNGLRLSSGLIVLTISPCKAAERKWYTQLQAFDNRGYSDLRLIGWRIVYFKEDVL
jgi:hypothetical protein